MRKQTRNYKGKYFFALYNQEDEMITTCENPSELAQTLERKKRCIESTLSRMDKRQKQINIVSGLGEWIKVCLIRM